MNAETKSRMIQELLHGSTRPVFLPSGESPVAFWARAAGVELKPLQREAAGGSVTELESLKVLRTERLESMSPRGSLSLIREHDGDILLTVIGESFGRLHGASVEFCTPGAGGGGSPRTYAALIELAAAMAADNLDQMASGRRPPGIDDEQQKALVEWNQQRIEAEREMQEFEKRLRQEFEE